MKAQVLLTCPCIFIVIVIVHVIAWLLTKELKCMLPDKCLSREDTPPWSWDVQMILCCTD